MRQIFRDSLVSIHPLLNLVQIISGGSQNLKINILACMAVNENSRSSSLDSFRIGKSELDIPYTFNYMPKEKLIPKEVERAVGRAPDRFCRLGADAIRDDAGDMCSKYIDDELATKTSLDPNIGLSGDGIRSALLDKNLLPDIFVTFLVTYSFSDDLKLIPSRNTELSIKAEYFLHLQTWYKDGLLSQFFESDAIIKLGINSEIIISDILPEINDVFFSLFRQGVVITPKLFFANLLHLFNIKKGLVSTINERIPYRSGKFEL
jgi:hypothetical protein